MKIEAPRIKAMRWLPDSLLTKYQFGFGAEADVKDGSQLTTALIDELAITPVPLKDKLYVLYASGVTDYEGKTFSPKQIASMVVHNNPYEPESICSWTGGIRTETGIVYGPGINKKRELLESLCTRLDEWTPLQFKPLESAIAAEKATFNPDMSISNHELAVYLVASYAQFVFLVIHPFWNRNGRISEEFMHLFCAQNQARKLVFWQEDKSRLTEASGTRMQLVNELAQKLLSQIMGNLGVSVDPNQAVTEGYKRYFLSGRPSLAVRTALSVFSPYHYRFISDFLSPEKSIRYFDALEKEVEVMIEKLRPESSPTLLSSDEYARQLLDHHLNYGRFEKIPRWRAEKNHGAQFHR